MSTLQPQTNNKNTLPQFKSTNSIICRPKRTPSLHPKSNMSGYLPSPNKNSIDVHNTSFHKTLLETNLPSIQSKRNSQKRSGYLQMWLDQALDPQENSSAAIDSPLRVDVDKTGPLKTVQKFQIDKKYLKSQNLSAEVIEKIYSSLYVYTHGINHSFEQILTLTKTGEHVQQKIVDSFWKAFIRLLEGCTSFRTTFQIVEQGHLKSKLQLKEAFLQKEQIWMAKKAELQEENLRLLRRIGEQGLTLSKLMTDYDISEATLQLTDQAFNDEVNTRLKFEEKVNQMFSSYDQLRTKYNLLLQDMRHRETLQEEANKLNTQLRQGLDLERLRLEETKKQLAYAQATIQDREKQLAIQRQELFEMAGQNSQLQEQKEINQDEYRKIITKAGNYRQLSEEYKAESQSKTLLFTELQKRINEQEEEINGSRQREEDLYNQLRGQGQSIGKLEAKLLQEVYTAQQNKKDKEHWKSQAQNYESTNRQLKDEIDNLQTQLTVLQGELQIKDSFIQKNKLVLSQLQASNNKAQTLLKSNTAQKQRLELQMQQSAQIVERFKQEMTGMRMLLQSKVVELGEAHSKLTNEREVFRSKIAGLKDQVQVKDQKVLEMHNQNMENNSIVKNTQTEIESTRDNNRQLRSQVHILQAERSQLMQQLDVIKQERQLKGSMIEQLHDQMGHQEEQSLIYQATMKQQQQLLAADNQQAKAEASLLISLLQGYRSDRENKVSFVHPMLYEDALEQINRLTQGKQQMIIQLKQYQNVQQELSERLEQQNCKNKETETSLQHSQGQLAVLSKQLMQLRQSNQVMQKRLSMVDTENKLQDQIAQKQLDELTLEHDKLTAQFKTLQNQVQVNQNLIASLQKEQSQWKEQRQQQSVQLSQMAEKLTQCQQQAVNIQSVNAQLNIQNAQLQRFIQQFKQRIPNTHQEVQTEPTDQRHTDKKALHAFKFQLPETHTSIACQASEQEIDSYRDRSPGVRPDPRKVEATEFRRALKITYMRR